MQDNYGDKPAFPIEGSLAVHQGITVREYMAIHAPEPDSDRVLRIMEQERLANPHNDSYRNKVRRREYQEISCALRYEWADMMIRVRRNERS